MYGRARGRERDIRSGCGATAGVQEPLTLATERRLRLALTAFLALYGIVLALHPERYGWLDSLDVAIHEVGHPPFALFGEFIGVRGGTLVQLLIPARFEWYVRRRGARHAAPVAL